MNIPAQPVCISCGKQEYFINIHQQSLENSDIQLNAPVEPLDSLYRISPLQ